MFCLFNINMNFTSEITLPSGNSFILTENLEEDTDHPYCECPEIARVLFDIDDESDIRQWVNASGHVLGRAYSSYEQPDKKEAVIFDPSTEVHHLPEMDTASQFYDIVVTMPNDPKVHWAGSLAWANTAPMLLPDVLLKAFDGRLIERAIVRAKFHAQAVNHFASVSNLKYYGA